MTKYIAIFIVGAITSITAVQAGDDCASNKTECGATAQKVAAASCSEKTASTCCSEKTAKTTKSIKVAKKAQPTAKGGYRG